MKNQFKEAKEPQIHGAAVANTRKQDKGPQGSEGNPNQRLAHRGAFENEDKHLDRRPADVATGNATDRGNETSSAVAGIQNDQPYTVSKDRDEEV